MQAVFIKKNYFWGVLGLIGGIFLIGLFCFGAYHNVLEKREIIRAVL